MKRNPRNRPANSLTYYLGSWISARRTGRCCRCGCDIMQGDSVKYIPAEHRTLCYSCGNQAGQAVLGFINTRLPL